MINRIIEIKAEDFDITAISINEDTDIDMGFIFNIKLEDEKLEEDEKIKKDI